MSAATTVQKSSVVQKSDSFTNAAFKMVGLLMLMMVLNLYWMESRTQLQIADLVKLLDEKSLTTGGDIVQESAHYHNSDSTITTNEMDPLFVKSEGTVKSNSGPLQCTLGQATMQTQRWCAHFPGRHNLKMNWHILRVHLPEATLFVDVGANKGLTSSRMFELWRPSYGMTPTIYAKSWVKPYYESHNITKKMAGDECGIENYCVGKNTQPENDRQEKMVNDLSPLLPEHLLAEHDFVVHSFEPSNQLFEMHQQFGQNPAPEYLNLKSHWQWHKIAAADLDGDVFFDSLWNEGSSIAINKGVPNTRAAKLDTLAYGSEQMFGDRIIDVLKIDAEGVDAQVVSGASRLLKEGRIRVVMWETPNKFPVTFPDWFGGEVQTYEELFAVLGEHADMSCYFPSTEGTEGNHYVIKLSDGCFTIPALESHYKGAIPVSNKPGPLSEERDEFCASPHCPYKKGCPITFSNAMCVNREKAPSLYQAMEKAALYNY